MIYNGKNYIGISFNNTKYIIYEIKKIKRDKRFFKNLKHELLKKLDNWKKFKLIRGKIEDFFKLLKQELNL